MEETHLIDPKELVGLSSNRFAKASEARIQWETDYIVNWNIYANDYSADNRNKAGWQAKGYIPYLSDMVDRIVGSILEAYEAQISRLYKSGAARRALAATMRALVMGELALNHFDVMLDEEVLEIMVSGFGVIRDEWDYSRGETKLSVVDPLDFYRVPDGMDDFLACQRSVMEKGSLAVYLDDPAYDQEAIKALLDGGGNIPTLAGEDSDSAEDQKRKDEKASLARYETLHNPASVYEFWGRMFDKDGDMIADGATLNWVVCGDKVIRHAAESEYWDNGMPYSFGYAKRVKNAAYPQAILRDHVVLQRGVTRTLNATADKLRKHQTQWIAMKGLVSREQIMRGINTGKVWVQKHPGPMGLQAVTPAMTLDPEFALIQLLERAMQLMGMTETDMGQASTRSREPLGVARMRSAGSQSFLATVARRIERTLLASVIKRVIVNILQFKLHEPSNPNFERNVVEFLGPEKKAGLEIMRVDDEARRAMLKTEFSDVRVRGLTDEVTKQEKAAGMNYFLRFYSQLVKEAVMMAQSGVPGLQEKAMQVLGMVNQPGLVYEAAQLTGYDPEMLLTPEALKIVDEADAGAAAVPELPAGEPMEVVPPASGIVGGGYGSPLAEPVAAEAGRSIYD